MFLIMKMKILCAVESQFLRFYHIKFMVKTYKWHGLKCILSTFQGSRKQHGRIMTWKGIADNKVALV
jgi:hypothetical protein